MKTYHKIQTVYKRDPETKYRTLLEGQFATPEFAFLAANEWVFTEKVDGTNIRIMFDGEDLMFGGKTDRAQMPPKLLTRLDERFLPQVEKFHELFPHGACFYGEGYGPKIQKGGGNYREDQDFVLFDVKVGDWWLQRPDVEDIARQFDLDIVPIIGTGTLYDMVEMVRPGFNSTWGNFTAEGIIARPLIELKTRSGGRIITKLKHKDF
jgi:hypothetical protein